MPANEEEKQSQVIMRESVGFWQDGFRRLRKNKVAMVSLFVIIVVMIFSFIVPAFYPYDYKTQIKGSENLHPMQYSEKEILAVTTLVISLGTGIPAAYAFSRKRFPGRKAILKLLILLYAFPSLLSMTALYKLLSPMGLINTRTGLVIVYTGTMAVFALWNMKGYFDTIPVEIEEAAMIDGATQLEQVTKIVLPLAKPTIAVTAMMVLVYVWNEYIFAINFMTGSDTYTLAAGLYSLQATEMSGSWPIFSAASLIVSLPILIVFFALQKNMTEGLTSGGVKG